MEKFFSVGNGKPSVFDIRVFRVPYSMRAVIVESVAAVYMGYLAWMAVRFGEVPRIIGFAMLSVVLAVDAMVRRRRISDK